MGLLESFFGGRVANPALLSALAAFKADGSDDNLIQIWQRLLKGKVLLATTPEGAKSFSKIRQIRDAISVPFQSDTNARGDVLLAVFTDNDAYHQFAHDSQTSVTMTGEQAFILASSKGLLGLSVNPKSETATELKVWQHLIFIEKLADANKLNALATKLSRSGNHADAEGVLKGAIAAAQRDPGAQHPFTAELNLELGKAMRTQGKLNEAEWVYKRALSIYEGSGSNDLELAQTAEALGSLYIENSKPTLASPLLIRALNILESVPGAKPDSIGRILCQIAEIKLQEGSFEDAEAYFKRAANSLEEKKHPEVVTVLNKMGAMYISMGRPKEAHAHYSRTLLLTETIKRCREIDIATAAFQLANLAMEEGKLHDAEPLLHRALEAYRREGTALDIEEVHKKLRQLDEKINEDPKKKDEKEPENAQSGVRGKFGSPGKKPPELPLLDFTAIKNNAPKANYAPGARADKTEATQQDPEEQALARMREFLNSVDDDAPINQAPKPSGAAPKESAAAPKESEAGAEQSAQKDEDETISNLPTIPANGTAFGDKVDTTKSNANFGEDSSDRPDIKDLLNRAGSNTSAANAALDIATSSNEQHEEDDLDTDTLFALAKQSATNLKSVSSLERTHQDIKDAADKQSGEQKKIEMAKTLEASIPPPVPKPTALDRQNAQSTPATVEAITPEPGKSDSSNSSVKDEDSDKKSFGRQIAGEISSVFNKSIFGKVVRSERFDNPIAKAEAEGQEKEALQAKVTEAAESLDKAAPQPEKKSLFGAPVDLEISYVFNKSVLGDITKSDRFDQPISNRAESKPASSENESIGSAAAAETPSAAVPEAAAETQAAAVVEPATATVETPAAPVVATTTSAVESSETDHTAGLFTDDSLDSSSTDMPAEHATSESVSTAATTQPSVIEAPTASAKQEEPAATLFTDELDSSLNEAFSSILAEPKTEPDRFDKPIQERPPASEAAPAAEVEVSLEALAKELKKAETKARYDTPIQERAIVEEKPAAEGTLFDQGLDESLNDAFNSLLAEPKAEPDRFDKPIQVRAETPEAEAPKAVEAPKASEAPKAESTLFTEELDTSLNDAFASLLADPSKASETRFDKPIAERLGEASGSTAAAVPTATTPDAAQPAAAAASVASNAAAVPIAATPEPAALPATAPAAAPAAARTPEDLIRLLESQLQADPENSELWLRKGTALVQQQKLDEAIKVFDKVTKMRPNDVKAWYCKGSSLHLKNQFEDALYCFNHVLNLDKENVKAMMRKAECLMKLGRADQGMVIYDRILLLQPKFVAGWLSKARALLQQRKLEDARTCYELVLTLDPANEEATKAKNLITSKLGVPAG